MEPIGSENSNHLLTLGIAEEWDEKFGGPLRAKSWFGLLSVSLQNNTIATHRTLPSKPPERYRVVHATRLSPANVYVLMAHLEPNRTKLETWRMFGNQVIQIPMTAKQNPYAHLARYTIPQYAFPVTKEKGMSRTKDSDRPDVVAVDPVSRKAVYDSNWEYDLRSRKWKRLKVIIGDSSLKEFYWNGQLYATPNRGGPTYEVDDSRKHYRSLGYRIIGRSLSGKYWVVASEYMSKVWLAKAK